MNKCVTEKLKYWNSKNVPQKHEIFVTLNNHLSLIVIEPNLKKKDQNLSVAQILFRGDSLNALTLIHVCLNVFAATYTKFKCYPN